MPLSEAHRKALLAEAQRRVEAADGGDTSTLAGQRQTAEKYYRGDPFGNEVAGRSQVVSRDVAQYVDSQMPSLMRIFASGDEAVVFEPTGPEDEEGARQATEYVNWIWRQNDGFLRFHHWFKDGLLAKLGTVKIWWDDSPTTTRETYRNLSDAELAAMQADRDIEVGTVETRQEEAAGPDGLPTMVTLHDIEVVKTDRSGRVRVANVPPEEFIFGRRTKDDSDSDVFAHVTKKRRSDLIANGFDAEVVAKLATGSDADNDAAKTVRFRDVDDAGTSDDTDEVDVVEAYFRFAPNEDEAAALWQVTYSGSEILACEEVDDHPFACVTPVLMPHRLVGMSTADQTMDIQMVKSTIWRQMLDNLYLNNAPQVAAVEGQVNLDDLLTRRPGGVVRMKAPNMVTPIPVTPLGPEPYQMIEYLDTQGEQRTGSTRYNQGLDANSLNKTASGINLIQNAAAQRLELIARVYAETGVKRAFRRILALVQRHQTKAQVIRLRGRWVEMDPRAWSNQMDCTVTVGLGNGNKDQTLAHIMALLQLDATIVQMQGGVNGPLLTADGIYAKLKKLIEAAGLRSVESYYSDPSSPEMQQAMANRKPPPDPKVMEAQAKLALQREEAAAQLALDREKAAHDAALARQKAEDDAKLAMWKAEQEIAVERAKLAGQAELEKLRAGLDMAKSQAALGLQERMGQFETMHETARHHADLMVQDRQERERIALEREAAEEEARRVAAEAPAEDDDMAKEPSDEYRAMVTMAQGMMQAVNALTEVAQAQQQTSAELVTAVRKMTLPRRLVKDAAGTRSEIVE